jgi:hypothetical protein
MCYRFSKTFELKYGMSGHQGEEYIPDRAKSISEDKETDMNIESSGNNGAGDCWFCQHSLR